MMQRLLTTVFALGLASAVQAAGPAPEGRVILTVAGDLPSANAPAATADDASFTGYLDLSYDKAMAFDDLTLDALPQHEVTAPLPGSDKAARFTGPRLSDLLRASGAEGKTALPMALDGYQAEIPWDNITTYEPILATHADGKPLAIGGLGPAMVVYPVVADKEINDDLGALQVFATFLIEVE